MISGHLYVVDAYAPEDGKEVKIIHFYDQLQKQEDKYRKRYIHIKLHGSNG